MWLMDKWEAWSKERWDVYGSKLQARYDFWSDYDDPELRAKCKKIWDGLSKDMQKKIYDMIMGILKQYGPEFAKKILIAISQAFVAPTT